MKNLIQLRSFLEIDRLSICQLQSGNKVKVIAESIYSDRFPSIQSYCFSLDNVLPHSRELLFQFRIGAMINVERKTVLQIPPAQLDVSPFKPNRLSHLPEASPILQQLIDMRVAFCCVMPIFQDNSPWGVMMAHHSEATFLVSRKLERLGVLVDQLSLSIAQEALRMQAQARAEQEKLLNRVNALFESSSTPDFQHALESTVAAFQGSGGKLYVGDQSGGQNVREYTYGVQPDTSSMPDSALIHHYRIWQNHYTSGGYQVWAIADLYQSSELQSLFEAFRSTPIQSFLMVPLVYRQQLLGYLCIFRNSVTSTPPPIEQVSSQQLDQGQKWTEIELAQRLGQKFARGIHEYKLSQQLQNSHAHLNTERQQQTNQLQQQESLSKILTQVQTSNDLETTFRSATKALCRALQAERVSIYRFNADWGGEFIHDLGYVVPKWNRMFKLGVNTPWNDTYLQDTQGGRYRHNETFITDDVSQAELSSCHLEIYEQFQIKAFATVPIFVGKRLWGVLAAYQHSQPRHWAASDVLFTHQTATALGLALQRAELMNLAPGGKSLYPTALKNIST